MTAVRVNMDSWRLWMMVAFAGIVLLFICVLVLFAKQTNANARERERISADKVAAATQARIANNNQVQSCVASYRSSPNVLRILDLLDVLANNSIAANTAAREQDPNSPLDEVRKQSLIRLRPAPRTILTFRLAVKKDQRTKKECEALAKKLHVDIRPLLKGKL